MTIEQIRPEHTWKLRSEVLYPNQKPNEMVMEQDNDGYHFAVFQDNRIMAVVSLFKHERDWQFRKLAVADGLQGQGIGGQLLDYITEFVARENGKLLWCNARLSAVGFYNKFGFSAIGKVFHKNGVDYMVMQKHLPPK